MFDWESIPAIIDVITQGLLWTVIISITSIIIGYIIGLATGFARAQHIRFLQTVSSVYVWLIRSTPILVQALYIYFVFPKLFGIRMGHEAAGILCVSLNAGAYISEIVRGAILEVPKGQWEAGQSLGMTKAQIVFKLILPLAVRSMLPALGNQFIITLKDTSILTIIGVAEMTYQAGQYASSTFNFVESYTILALFYLVLISALTMGIHYCERRMGVGAK